MSINTFHIFFAKNYSSRDYEDGAEDTVPSPHQGKIKTRVWNPRTPANCGWAWRSPATPAFKRQRKGISRPIRLPKANQISKLEVKMRGPETPIVNFVHRQEYVHN